MPMNMSSSINRKRNFAQANPPIRYDMIGAKIAAGIIRPGRDTNLQPVQPAVAAEQPPVQRFKALRMRASNDQSTL